MDEALQNKWKIHAKVIRKSAIKSYKSGRLFKLDLEDEMFKEESQKMG
jgi:hypothetical protein